MAVIMTGVLMTAVDTTIVVLALPEIQRGLHVDLSAVVWVIISFLLVITLLATQVGRLGDMFGRVRMYETGFAVFVLGSLACALAWNEPSIIAFRVLQGVRAPRGRAHAAAVDLPGSDHVGLPARLAVPGPGQLRRALPADHVLAGAAPAVPDPRLAAARPRLRAGVGGPSSRPTARR